jgi:electron transport complex protein RnfC
MHVMFHRYGQFAGGIDLPDENASTIDQPIGMVDSVATLRVPLAPCGTAGASPVVDVGTNVQCGERLAAAPGPGGVDIFAPAAGRVAALTTAVVRHGRDLLACPAIELTDIHGGCGMGAAREVRDWRTVSSNTIRQQLAEGQIATSRPRPEPLIRWVQRAVATACQDLIVNAMENQPYITADHRLLVEYGPQVMQGLAILALACEARQVFLAVDARRTRDYASLVEPAIQYSVNRVALPHKYPIGADPILIKVLTRREVPLGGRPTDIGAAVIDASTCLAAYRWVACGQRLTGRVVTVNGDGVARPGNVFVPFGTSCHDLLGETDAPCVLGGPMTGRQVDGDAVVSPACESVLAVTPTPHAPPSQCIRCGWCRDHCPVRLNVAMLNDMYELGDVAQAEHLGVTACVGCGVCSYVCPARLPLTDRVRRLAGTVRHHRRSMPLLSDMAPSPAAEADR